MSGEEATGGGIQKRCAVVGIVGRTNAGKSTLLNQLVGEKVSIVSPVAQTTRNTVRGILTEERGQLVFLDTPGLHKAEGTLGTLLNRMARQSAAGVDVLVVLFDGSRHPRLEDDGWMRRVLFAEQPVIFVLNKSDLGNAREPLFHALWEKIQEEKGQRREVDWISLSALKAESVKPLLDRLFELALPMEELLFPEDVVTDYPRKLAISDTIREKFLHRLRDEVPHELGILVEKIDESKPGRWEVIVTVYVNRPSQKGIVIGNKGRVLKEVTREAQRELSEIFEVTVALDLWVKIERDWMKNFWLLRQMGYAGANA
ncbi:MAG: GTPase Era [Kiritimatiellae bacterium]|nr:GTPase Era [Kiritimatiellia bacterium]